jgi:septum formation protein
MFQQAGVLILASASPRRAALLGGLDVDFAVHASDVPEVPLPGEGAIAFARRAARDKALAVARVRSHEWILGADTVVVIDGEILGKPRDGEDARRMLRMLSGRRHQVITAVVLVGPGAAEDEVAVRSDVEFRALGEEEIESYAASGEPLDKAGAYAIQGGASGFVRSVAGSYSNVVGLPLDEVRKLLEKHGLLDGGGAEERTAER